DEQTARAMERLANATSQWEELVETYQQALARGPISCEALGGLGRMYRRSQAWQPLADTLALRAEATTDNAECVRSWLEVGSISADHLADAGAAIAAYERVRDLEPANLVALRALEKLYDRSAQHERYVNTLEALAVASPEADRVALYE